MKHNFSITQFWCLIFYSYMLMSCQNGFKAVAMRDLASVHPENSGGSQNGVQAPVLNWAAKESIDGACLNNQIVNSYNFCLFNKNYVKSGDQITVNLADVVAQSHQNLAVKLQMPSDGSLNTSFVKIETHQSARYSVLNPAVVRAGEGSLLEQAMVFYYANKTIQGLSSIEPLALSQIQTKFIVDDKMSGFHFKTKSIHLQKSSSYVAAWDASQIVYHLGLAEASVATQGRLEFRSEPHHKVCGANPNGCCLSKIGCSKALQSGIGMIFVALLFPDSPVLGELSSLSREGLLSCSILRRNLNAMVSLNADQVYTRCPDSMGSIYAMGDLYASMWWRMRGQIQTSTSRTEFDRFFLRHIRDIEPQDTFIEVKKKLLLLSQSSFNSQFESIINSEWAFRGL